MATGAALLALRIIVGDEIPGLQRSSKLTLYGRQIRSYSAWGAERDKDGYLPHQAWGAYVSSADYDQWAMMKPAWARRLHEPLEEMDRDSNTWSSTMPDGTPTDSSTPTFAWNRNYEEGYDNKEGGDGWAFSDYLPKNHSVWNAWGADNWSDDKWDAKGPSEWKDFKTRAAWRNKHERTWEDDGLSAWWKSTPTATPTQFVDISKDEREDGRIPNSWPDPFSGDKDGPTLKEWKRAIELWLDGEGRRVPAHVVGPRVLRISYGTAALVCEELSSSDVNNDDGLQIIYRLLESSTLIQEMEDARDDQIQK